MSMMDEIEKFMSTTNNSLNYKIVDIGGSNLYIEGIKSVVEFGEKVMKFQLKKKLLEVDGENLQVKYLDKNTCIIQGNILAVVKK